MSAVMWFDDELRQLEERGLRRRLRTVESAQGREVVIDGRPVINFSSNDYLGLAAHPALVEASQRASRDFGAGAGASRLIVGNLAAHDALEQTAARLCGAEAACLFNSGYHANVGTISALAGRGDVVVSDELNHASIIDGCRLSRAQVEVYRHGDVADAERRLASASGARRRLLVTDSLFSMDGDRAPLVPLSELARRYDALLYVDEAHSMGTLGPGGRGVAAEAGVVPDVTVATLGKSFGSFGAFVLGTASLREFLVNRARSLVFTTGLPPSVLGASKAGLELVFGDEGERRRRQLQQNVARLAAIVGELHLGNAPQSQIWPLLLGSESRAMTASSALFEEGLLGQGIRPPTVPEGACRIRFTLTATHEPGDMDRLRNGLSALRHQGLLLHEEKR